MDKLFEKCLEFNNHRFENTMAWNLVGCRKDSKYKDLSSDEIFEMLFWEQALKFYNDDQFIKMILIKYGDKSPSLLKQYIKTSEIKFRLSDDEQVLFEEILSTLSVV